MLKNVGFIDKIVRFILALGLVVFGLLNLSTGLWWVGLLAIVPLATGIAGYCPIWHASGINTVRIKKL